MRIWNKKKGRKVNPLIVTVMLGMNKFSERDDGHPFDMSYLHGYNTMWQPQVTEKEKDHSSLFYDTLCAIEKARIKTLHLKDYITFIFGRGTIGDGSEEALYESLMNTFKHFGKHTPVLMVGKSYGVVDSLRALQLFNRHPWKPKVDTMVMIDGYAFRTSLRDITKHMKFVVPLFVARAFNSYQRVEGFKGLKACDRRGVKNKQITKLTEKQYDHYDDEHVRELSISHFNMDEICAVNPCCFRANRYYSYPDILRMSAVRILSKGES